MKRPVFRLFVLAVCVLLISACGGSGSSDTTQASPDTTNPDTSDTTAPEGPTETTSGEPLEPVKIGSTLGFSGAVAASGTEMVNGLQLAVDHLNEAGGILGHPIELSLEDDQNEPQQAVTNAQRMLSDGIHAFVGSSSSGTGGALAEVLNGTVPSILTMTSTPAIAELGYPNIVLFNNPASQKEAPTIEFIGNLEGVEVVAMVFQNNDYGKGLLAQYEEAWADGNGPEIAYAEFFQNDQTDFSAIVAGAQAVNPDAFYISGFTEQFQRILYQGRDIGFEPEVVWLSGEAINPTGLALDPDILEGVFAGAVFNPYSDAPEVQAFSAAYKELHDIEPGYFAASNYDAMMYMAAAMEAAGSIDDVEAISSALRTVDFSGVRGPVTMNEFGQVLLEASVVTVQDGVLVFVEG